MQKVWVSQPSSSTTTLVLSNHRLPSATSLPLCPEATTADLLFRSAASRITFGTSIPPSRRLQAIVQGSAFSICSTKIKLRPASSRRLVLMLPGRLHLQVSSVCICQLVSQQLQKLPFLEIVEFVLSSLNLCICDCGYMLVIGSVLFTGLGSQLSKGLTMDENVTEVPMGVGKKFPLEYLSVIRLLG
ncbi:hypothetical protein PIB30_081410 [Stylosanthes scabra]|uniref:Uncharacterized protein n=1 Tax=Stylosanthes scabra TaxID=79078 RepID=A0ABU6VUB9_9FABA|nr:hypothetical protein [Stylosanthes scabra]